MFTCTTVKEQHGAVNIRYFICSTINYLPYLNLQADGQIERSFKLFRAINPAAV